MSSALRLLPPSALLLAAAAALVPGSGDDELDLPSLERLRDEILPEVAELRGLAFKRSVKVAVSDKDAFETYAQERSERMADETTRRSDTEVARLLALVPADMDLERAQLDLLREQAAGFYDPTDEAFFVAQGFPGGDFLRLVLAHELTHALDDQHFDIDGTLEPLVRENTDAALGFHAVVEGSGSAIMTRWMIQRASAGRIDMKAVQSHDLTAGLEDAPEFLWKPMLFSYMAGASFLARSDKLMAGQMGGQKPADIDRAFREPPRSTEQVLHPAKYWSEEQRDEPVDVRLTVEPPDGWSVLRSDTLGELGCALLVNPPSMRRGLDAENPMAILSLRFTSDAAAGWGGDRYLLLGKGDARVLRGVSTWDTEDDAREFQTALEGMSEVLRARAIELGGTGSVAIARDGDVVTLTVVSGAAEGEAQAAAASIAVEIGPRGAPARPAEPAGATRSTR